MLAVMGSGWEDKKQGLIMTFEVPLQKKKTTPFLKAISCRRVLSAIRVVSSVYLRLLIFLLAILFPACASSSPAFHMMYSA